MIRRKGVSLSSRDSHMPLTSLLPAPSHAFPLPSRQLGSTLCCCRLFCLARILYRWNHMGCVQFGWVSRFLFSFFLFFYSAYLFCNWSIVVNASMKLIWSRFWVIYSPVRVSQFYLWPFVYCWAFECFSLLAITSEHAQNSWFSEHSLSVVFAKHK